MKRGPSQLTSLSLIKGPRSLPGDFHSELAKTEGAGSVKDAGFKRHKSSSEPAYYGEDETVKVFSFYFIWNRKEISYNIKRNTCSLPIRNSSPPYRLSFGTSLHKNGTSLKVVAQLRKEIWIQNEYHKQVTSTIEQLLTGTWKQQWRRAVTGNDRCFRIKKVENCF